jgi:hypothetical protein
MRRHTLGLYLFQPDAKLLAVEGKAKLYQYQKNQKKACKNFMCKA